MTPEFTIAQYDLNNLNDVNVLVERGGPILECVGKDGNFHAYRYQSRMSFFEAVGHMFRLFPDIRLNSIRITSQWIEYKFSY